MNIEFKTKLPPNIAKHLVVVCVLMIVLFLLAGVGWSALYLAHNYPDALLPLSAVSVIVSLYWMICKCVKITSGVKK